nr:MAG TPA: hypothetical protein [Caudoviricetes sp.]
MLRALQGSYLIFSYSSDTYCLVSIRLSSAISTFSYG